jgi:succinylglutamic semialdehyde dehydrogenase
MFPPLKNKHYIQGKWVEGKGPQFSAINPATAQTIWTGRAADQETVNQAVMAAKEAFPKWSGLDMQTRIKYLERFQQALVEAKAILSEAISESTGKPLWESATEVDAMINKIPISIEASQVRCPTIEKQQPHGLSTTTHRAHGVMAVLGPFNFPGHLPNGHIVPALLAGNTVVFKPSELAPLVAELTLQCWDSCHLPAGVINLVQGARETGQYLSEHPQIDGLLFTGSWPTGKHLSEIMAKTPYKILALEMGGNNALVIGAITDIKAAAYITVQSAFLSAGQRCTCARRLIVPKGHLGDRFIDALIEMMNAIHVGAYTDKPEPFMGPVISKQAAERLLSAQKALVDAGAVPIVPLKKLEKGDPFLSPGLVDVTAVVNRPDEEYFGPFLQIVRVENFAQAIEEADRTNYGLVAGLLSDSRDEYETFFKSVRAGVINWNMPLTGASSASPFGGLGRSGNNRPSAFYAADYCAYPIASMTSDHLQMPQKTMPGLKIE